MRVRTANIALCCVGACLLLVALLGGYVRQMERKLDHARRVYAETVECYESGDRVWDVAMERQGGQLVVVLPETVHCYPD